MALFGIGGPRDGPAGGDGDRKLRVFVTGATGYIGRAVVREFVDAGHKVAGLTRWAENTLRLARLGARAVVGDVRDPATYRKLATGYDALVHLAAESSDDTATADRAAIDTLLWAAARGAEERRAKDPPPPIVIYTSGCFVLGETGAEPADEDASTDGAPEAVAWRPANERRVLDADGDAVATAVIRPGMVYGGHGGLIGELFRSAVEDGAAAYVGDGRNRWSPVYRGDLARLYRLVAERAARGIYHCTADGAVPVVDLARAAAEAAGRGGETRSIPLEEARASMGVMADALVMDQVVASPRARALGWRHEHPAFTASAADLYREWREGAPSSPPDPAA